MANDSGDNDEKGMVGDNAWLMKNQEKKEKQGILFLSYFLAKSMADGGAQGQGKKGKKERKKNQGLTLAPVASLLRFPLIMKEGAMASMREKREEEEGRELIY